MSEKINAEIKTYDPLDDQGSFIGNEMKAIFRDYGAQLQNGQKHAYDHLDDVGRKVNGICWDWAAKPEYRGYAIQLRSLHIVRALERFIYSGNKNGTKDYQFSLADSYDDFWPSVELATDRNIERLAIEKYESVCLPYSRPQEHAAAIIHRFTTIGGYVIDKCVLFANESPIHVTYLTAHESASDLLIT
jgi:hypothetical protein